MQRKIGEGTFAEVWRALDQDPASPGKPVALKIFRPLSDGGSTDAWDPVYREVAAGLRMAAHPNVVRSWALLDACFFAGQRTPCLVMDHVEGTNLALWLAGQPAPGVDTLAVRLGVMTGLLHGLAYAHSRGVAHQDISFGNVLVRNTTPPEALLTDFGCAQTAEAEANPEAEDEGQAMLQPINPPPYDLRQLLADSVRRDVYAFGTLCYLTVVGRHPLSDDWQTMRTGQWTGPVAPHRTLARRSLSDLGPWLRDLPGMAELSDLLLRCVSADPANRPASGAMVRAAWLAIMRAAEPERG